MKAFLPSLVFLFCVSCAASAPIKKEPKKLAPNVEREFRAAEAQAKAGDSKKALPKLKNFVQTNPDSELTADAYFLMGQLHQNAQRNSEAIANYNAVLALPVSHRFDVDAALRAARLQVKLAQYAEAEKTLANASNWKNPGVEHLLELERLRYEVHSALKHSLAALESAIFLAEHSTIAAEKDKFRALAGDSIDSRFGFEELGKIADNSKFAIVHPQAKFRYGLQLADQRQYFRAREYLADAANLAIGTELGERARNLVNQIDARHRVDSRTIGVVLPLSGKQAGIGYKALKGIQLGLGIYGARGGKPSGFKLAVIDSEGSPDMARLAIERLAQEDNVIAIIGGLLSKTAVAEAAKAQEFGIPELILSQKAGITQAGDFVFRNALTSQMQVQFLVDTAMAKLGMKNFAILFPNDAYGVEFANLFWDEVRARGGDIRGAQPYDPQETDFRGYVQRLVGTFYLEDRSDEYRLMTKNWLEKNPKRAGKGGPPPPEDLLPPIIDFDAIFIPDSAKAVGQIAPMLAYNNINNVRLIGTNIWNSPGLVSRGQRFVENSVFVDSFLATDPAFVNSDFYTAFKATFEEEPSLTEVQAYDSALILRQLIANGEDTRSSLQARLSKLENFPGALGPLSIDADREIRRPMSALTVKDGKISDLESTRR